MPLRTILGTTLVAATILGAMSSADAQSRRRGGGEGTVSACSIYGNGCTSAPVRRAGNDYEFRLPGGTWVSCKQSCQDTLRRETVDFWETQRENGGSDIN
ncbi:MAG TPA: hypothetical protein VNZ50_07960 [Hyphomicrobiaceae bacterium]|nr:hypothetical protein [Hyphomicrobiaceae bacterium]